MAEPPEKLELISKINETWGPAFSRVLRTDEASETKRVCDELLEMPDLPLFIRMKCHLMAGCACMNVIEAFHHLREAEKDCKECLARCLEEDREQIEIQEYLIHEALEIKGPELREYLIEQGEWVSTDGEDDEGGKDG